MQARNKLAMGRPRKRYDGRRAFTCSEVKETFSEGIC